MTENERQIKAILEDACARQDTATHSPLPWTWSWIDGEDEDEGKQWIEIRDAHGEEVAVLMVRDAAKWRTIVGPEREANAECIIRAVNLHADSVATPNLVDDRELATVLAALRFHQAENLQGIDEIPDLAIREIATDGGRLEALGFGDVDRLCERINLDAQTFRPSPGGEEAVHPGVQRIHDLLYLDVEAEREFHNPDKEWDADTMALVAEVVAEYIPRPRGRQESPSPAADAERWRCFRPGVIVSVSGGVADVLFKPEGIAVTIIDYDVEGEGEGDGCITTDPDGAKCTIGQWPASEEIVANRHWPIIEQAMRIAHRAFSRQWQCPDCHRVASCSYDDLAEIGTPYCGECDTEMFMI